MLKFQLFSLFLQYALTLTNSSIIQHLQKDIYNQSPEYKLTKISITTTPKVRPTAKASNSATVPTANLTPPSNSQMTFSLFYSKHNNASSFPK